MSKELIIIHHSAISRTIQPLQFNSINNYHKEKWGYKSSLGFYGGYNYLIEPTGEVKQYRLDEETGAHCKGLNETSIGVALTGNFSKEGEYPTESQIVSLRALLRSLMAKYSIPFEKIKPHRYFAKTECAGNNLTDKWFAETFAELNKGQEENLKKKISIIEKLIAIYQKLLEIIKGQKNN